MIKEGYNEDVDKFRHAQEQKARPGWRSWRLVRRRKPASRICVCSYNKVFGYYLEVTNSYKELVPEDCDPQTDTDQCRALYYAGIKRAGRYDPWCGGQAVLPWSMICICEVRDSIGEQVVRIQKTAKAIAASGCIGISGLCGTEQ